MKREFLLLLNMVLLSLSYSCNAQSDKGEVSESQLQSGMVKVYYFHFTQRCATCRAIEDETKKAIDELYSGALEEEKIAFIALNLEEEDGERMAEKLNISGQTLLIVKGGEQVNLTNEGFLYARTDPEKLREALQKAIGEI
ncbi:MAG: hypothetical protein JSV24_03905 [Bacteroidales bacterium]|nr:MAG: hypothetical protein JSV24_03905 [Bacteroidales bacterium]